MAQIDERRAVSWSVGEGPLGLSSMNRLGQVLVGNNFLDERMKETKLYNRYIHNDGVTLENELRYHSIWDLEVKNHVADLKWVDRHHFVYATGSKIVLSQTGPNYSFRDNLVLNNFHFDLIREIDVAKSDPGYMVSAGYDGNIVLSNIFTSAKDAESLPTSIIRKYPCKQSVSSVRWHHSSPQLCLGTTEPGYFHLFDHRNRNISNTRIVYDTKKPGLLSHTLIGDSMVLLGFQDSSLSTLDLRKTDSPLSFQVLPELGGIGSLNCEEHSATVALAGEKQTAFASVDEKGLVVVSDVFPDVTKSISFPERFPGRALYATESGRLVLRYWK